ncbi:MAG: hypothetical protein AB9907_11935 [Flexilinea sp.]
MKQRNFGKMHSIYFLLTAIEAAAAIVWLAVIQTDKKSDFFLGFSASRLAMIFILLVFLLTALTCLLLRIFSGVFKNRIQKFFEGRRINRLIPVFCPVITYLFSAILLYTGFVEPVKYNSYFERLFPFGAFFILLAIQTILFFASVQLNTLSGKSQNDRLLLKKTILILSIEILLFWMIKFTGIGITPDPFDWQPNGMAIHYWELAAALLSAAALFSVSFSLRKKLPEKIRTGFLFLLIWAGAALIWTAVPTMDVLKHSYFMEISAPNYVPYPASDAAYFGLWSESLMAGLGFKDTIVSRQFFVIILAFIQMITHKNMVASIDCLTILLALIPAFLFLLGKQIHSQGAGLLAAGIAIFRELNTLYLAPLFGVSDSKMFLSDMPALLFFLLFISVCVSWFLNSGSKAKSILAGGILGFCTLIRSQFILFLPLVVLIQFLRKSLPARKIAASCFLFSITTVAVLTPALVRSVLINGSLILEDSGIHGFEIARRYSDDPENVPTRIEGESSEDFSNRMEKDIVDFIIKKPGYVLGFITNHFIKDQIDSWLVLPAGIPTEFTIKDLTNTAYHDVENRLLKHFTISKLLFALIIALGIAAGFQRCGITGLLPLIFCSVYMLSTAAGRYSGWRFILPADWVYYFYFSVGIFEFIFLIYRRVAGRTTTDIVSEKHILQSTPEGRWKPVVLFTLLVLAGSLPVTIKYLIPNQIPQNSPEENFRLVQSLGDEFGEPYLTLEEKIQKESLIVINGRTIYPRYFEANQGLTSANPWTVYEVREFNRLGFVLLNRENSDVIIPMKTEPDYFPNSADCIVIGNQHEDGYFEGIAAIFPGIAGENGSPVIFQP